MFKKLSMCAISFLLIVLLGCSPVLAAELAEGESRVAIGADLTAEQRAQIYKDFDLSEGDAPELIVTNQEERLYLEGIALYQDFGGGRRAEYLSA